MELRAELTGRDGVRRPFRVSCEPSLPGLLGGVERLKGDVSAVLTELVLQEKGENGQGDGERESAGEEEEDDEEEEKGGDNSKNGTTSTGPPTKKPKTRDS